MRRHQYVLLFALEQKQKGPSAISQIHMFTSSHILEYMDTKISIKRDAFTFNKCKEKLSEFSYLYLLMISPEQYIVCFFLAF